jgi:hypothetical protein
MLRCAKTLKKNHLGILYERYTSNPNDSSITQGLAGRATGYDIGPNIICFTNIETIQKYDAMWKSEFESKDIPWISLTTTNGPGGPFSKGTFNYIKDDDESVESADTEEPTIIICKTQAEGRNYYNETLKERNDGRGPKEIDANIQGFYEATIRKIKKVYSSKEMYDERRCNIKNGAGYAFRPCYEDINDKSTLQFWLIHY